MCRELDFVSVKGKDEPTRIFEVFNWHGEEIRAKKLQLLPSYQEGLRNYTHQKWDEAIQLFNICLEIYPDDAISKMYVERCLQYKQNPPPPDWDGVLRMQEK